MCVKETNAYLHKFPLVFWFSVLDSRNSLGINHTAFWYFVNPAIK
jgi:hypothetical protein